MQSQRSCVLETQPGKGYRHKRHHIRRTVTIQDNPKAEDPFVLFPENMFNTSVTGNAPLEKPEVSQPEQSPNVATRSGRNVVCPQKLIDFVEY